MQHSDNMTNTLLRKDLPLPTWSTLDMFTHSEQFICLISGGDAYQPNLISAVKKNVGNDGFLTLHLQVCLWGSQRAVGSMQLLLTGFP